MPALLGGMPLLRLSGCLLLVLLGVSASAVAAPLPIAPLTSPDGRLQVELFLDEEGQLTYVLNRDGTAVLAPSRLGLKREDADFSTGLRFVSESRTRSIEESYEILTAKRRQNAYVARQKILRFENAGGESIELTFQLSDDGVAFRYHFPRRSDTVHRITAEVSSFSFHPGTRAWLQPMQEAKSGFAQSNPAYEEYYERDVPVGTPSNFGAGWVFPALFRLGENWILVSETGLGRNYCGSRLSHLSPAGEYTVTFADARERMAGGAVTPESTLPWTTPWRLIVVGSLATVAESMLGVHLAPPPEHASVGSGPGRASWSWALLKDEHTVEETQRRFVDLAADLGWEYTLVDALWDTQIGDERMRELVEYARSRNVQILVWYNSAGDWNTTPQTPRDRLLTPESRAAEFARLKQLGVAGVKIDFFGGDGQSVINYYHTLLEETARAGLVVNFHGATLPRGWQRTYPHLLTVEAVRGFEFVTFEQANADRAPTHHAMLPLTRNVFDPMDYTPGSFATIPNIERRTTAAHELALSVLFTSGIQHFVETPEGIASVPDYVREFLREVPAQWEDIRWIDGFPGEYIVLARRSGERWYVAGINGSDTEKALTLDLRELRAATGQLIAEGTEGGAAFRQETVDLPADGPWPIKVPARGGFVLTLP